VRTVGRINYSIYACPIFPFKNPLGQLVNRESSC